MSAIHTASATPVVNPQTRRAWLAQLRQDLAVPVTGVIGLADMLLRDAAERAPEEFGADLGRIPTAGRRLFDLIRELLNPDKTLPESEELGRRVRHDLRTPLNHIIGYCDLWLEEAQERLLDCFVADLQEIKTQGQRSL